MEVQVKTNGSCDLDNKKPEQQTDVRVQRGARSSRELLLGLINLGDKEDSEGRFRVVLDYDNEQDGARVLDGDGNVLGECYDLLEDVNDPQEMVVQQFMYAINNALKSNTRLMP